MRLNGFSFYRHEVFLILQPLLTLKILAYLWTSAAILRHPRYFWHNRLSTFSIGNDVHRFFFRVVVKKIHFLDHLCTFNSRPHMPENEIRCVSVCVCVCVLTVFPICLICIIPTLSFTHLETCQILSRALFMMVWASGTHSEWWIA